MMLVNSIPVLAGFFPVANNVAAAIVILIVLGSVAALEWYLPFYDEEDARARLSRKGAGKDGNEIIETDTSASA